MLSDALLFMFTGLDNIVALLSGRRYYLRVELPDRTKDPTDFVVLYSNFTVAPAAQLYKLTGVGTCCFSSAFTHPDRMPTQLFL